MFAGASRGAMARLADASIERFMGPGRPLVSQSEAFPYLGIVTAGSVVASFLSADGRDHLLYEVRPPETFAEIPLLDEHGALTTLASGPEGAVVILVPKAAVESACRIDARLAFQLACVTAARARTVARSVGRLAFVSTVRRVANVIREGLPDGASGQVEAPAPLRALSQSQIALRAGTVRVVAARALRSLAGSGAIGLLGGRIAVVDPARLAQWL